MAAMAAVKNRMMLKMTLLICASPRSKPIPITNAATFMPMPNSLCRTSDAITLPLVPLCSLVTRYTRLTSPLTDSAGTIISMKIPYQTKRFALMTEIFTWRELRSVRHDTE